MNRLLRHCYIIEYKIESWAFLAYLRKKGVFQSVFDTEKRNVNPYWYGSILDYAEFDKVLKELLDFKSLKISRLREIAEELDGDLNGPIVSLTGKYLKSKLKQLK